MAVAPLQHRFDGPRDAPVVLLIPALGTKWSIWEPQLPELTRHRRVLRVNHRGHGASPAPAGDYSLDDLAKDIQALMDSYQLERLSVVGIALGGMVALSLADRVPERIDRLALLSMAARAKPARDWYRRAEAVRESGMEAVAQEVARPWFTPSFVEARPDIRSGLLAEVTGIASAGFAACCELTAAADLRPLLGQVQAPTLVISGAHDPQTPPKRGRQVAAAMPRARFEVVKRGAHLVNIERADRVNELLLEHLAR